MTRNGSGDGRRTRSPLRARTARLAGAGLVVAMSAVVLSSTASAATVPAHRASMAPVSTTSEFGPNYIRLSKTELAEWRQQTATTAGRKRLEADFQRAFAGVATVGFGSRDRTGGALGPDLAVGVTGNHFWIIASYADIADGAIWSGVAACAAYAPEFAEVCSTAGELLVEWASGWGRASNHGVWAAIYWWPPHVSGGRW